ncbi:MAG: hypothetical protein AB7O59_10225 [Pirellulales bacterium]
MKWFMIAGEYLLGLVILFVTLLCILVAAFVSLLELPRYLRNTHK